jgi:hypothetical protein
VTNKHNSTTPRAAGKEQRRRANYADCCRAARQAFDKLRAQRLGAHPLKLQTLVAVVELTALYSRLSDEIGVRQLAARVYGVDRDDLTRSQRQRVGDSLRALRDAGIIEYAPKRGRYGRARIGLPPAEAESKTLATSVIDEADDGSKHPPGHLKAPADCDAKTPPSAATPSSSPEELPSEKVASLVTTSAEARQTTRPEGFAKGEDRPEVIDALGVIAKEAPAALAGDGREQIRRRLRLLSEPVFAACGLTNAYRNARPANPVGHAIRYLDACVADAA